MKGQNRLEAVAVPLGVVAVIVLFVVPVPPLLLSVLISANIAAALVVLAMALQVRRPLDFSVFPTLLLVATLFRLALNVAVTRLVLLRANAGPVIAAFGHFVVGGSLVVGLTVFLILIVIQFVVVTNGASRVAEVAARFTLDAMPGKQMAIDADLNAGLVKAEEARRRREEVAREADFYGAMDGASRFVRGDAIAALVIVAVNLIGGLGVGILAHHMAISQAVSTYSLLSVGDGLASQIPALLMSVSTGIVVTRAGDQDSSFGADLVGQFRRHAGALGLAGGVLALIGLFPGMPVVPFLPVGALVGGAGWYMSKQKATKATEEPPKPEQPTDLTPASMAGELRNEPLELALAGDYAPLLEPAGTAELPTKVRNLRKVIAAELGFVVPLVAVRTDPLLGPGKYRARVHGVEVASGETKPGAMLAIGKGIEGLSGRRTTDPVFGLPAVEVPPAERYKAAVAGATVLDRTSLVVTHLGEVTRSYAPQLLSLQQVRQLMDVARQSDPAVLDELQAAQVTAGDVLRVCRGLLAERVPVRSFVRILEAIAERARVSRDPEGLLESARAALGPQICANWATDGRLSVLVLSPPLEAMLSKTLTAGEEGSSLGASPELLSWVVDRARDMCRQVEGTGRRAVLVCASRLRPAMHRLLATRVPSLGVLSVAELSRSFAVDHAGTISTPDQAAAA
jgi:flagellar biosynthesis protein FlhA